MTKRSYVLRVNLNEYEEVLKSIHEQLVGNQDYIDSNILLNGEKYPDKNMGKIRVYIFEECENIPELRF